MTNVYHPLETSVRLSISKVNINFDREQTEQSKLEIVEERRREVFGQKYDAFADTLVRQLNTQLWEEVALIHDDAVKTMDFFEVYAKYFPE